LTDRISDQLSAESFLAQITGQRDSLPAARKDELYYLLRI
jgi:hypothetical protein